MSEQMKDGGPAFPVPDCGHGVPIYEGMTMRDYFAAKAMQGDWAAQDLATTGVFSLEASDFTLAAKTYYAMADAMLAAREVTP